MYRRKILIVDDERHILDVLEKRLEKEGYAVLRAMDGIKAMEILEQEHPALIILDILLPGELDGLTICKQLKTNYRYQKIPIIILSALGREFQVEEGLKAGASAYFPKPFNNEELIAKIKELILD